MWSTMLSQFELFWSQRDVREKRMLGGAASLVALLILVQVFIAPAFGGRQRLHTQIPQLRQQVAEINALAAEQTNLSANLAQAVEPVSRELLEASLAARGLKAQSLSVNEEIVRLQMNTANYSSLMEWLVESQKSTRLTVEEARLTALSEPGQVQVSLALKQQRSGF